MGAGLIVLLGTEKGKKLAEKLQKDGLHFLDGAEAKVQSEVAAKVKLLEEKRQQLIEKGQELIRAGQAIEQEIVETAGDVQSDIVEAVAEKADYTLTHIEELQKRGRETTQRLHKNLFKNIPKK